MIGVHELVHGFDAERALLVVVPRVFVLVFVAEPAFCSALWVLRSRVACALSVLRGASYGALSASQLWFLVCF